MPTHPEVLWAQRSSLSAPEKNIVYLTVNLPDILEPSLQYTLTSTSLSFKADAGSGTTTAYAFDLDFFAEVEPEQSTKRLTSRSFFVILRKKESKSEYWTRLTKEKVKTPFIKTDFSRWVDEDEQDGNPNPDEDFGPGGIPGMGGGMDFSEMMAQAGGSDLGGAPLVDEQESDDDDDDDGDDGGPPPLEDVEPSK